VKEQVVSAIARITEDADFRDVKDEIAFLAALREAQDDIAERAQILLKQPEAGTVLDELREGH
jgi:hypothetical protein